MHRGPLERERSELLDALAADEIHEAVDPGLGEHLAVAREVLGAAGDLAATASVSEEMATLNTECSQYFEQEVRTKPNSGPDRTLELRPTNAR